MEDFSLYTLEQLIFLLIAQNDLFRDALRRYPAFKRNHPEFFEIRSKLTYIKNELGLRRNAEIPYQTS